MKNVFLENKVFWVKRAKKQMHLRVMEKRRKRAHNASTKFIKKDKGNKYRFTESEKIFPPDNMSLYDNHDRTCDFLNITRGRSPRRRYFTFNRIRSLTPETALVMAAAFDRLRILNERIKSAPIETKRWHPHVRKHFLQLGLAELLGFDRRLLGRVKADSGVIYFPFKRAVYSQSQSLSTVDVYKQLKGDLRDIITPIEDALVTYLFEAFTEAADNALEHAYDDTMADGTFIPGGWWTSGAYDTRKKRLFLSVYDQGVGIPNTIIRKLQKFLPKSDSHSILTAVEYGKTRTKKKGRGKGFKNMQNLIDVFGNGELRVYSGRGIAIYKDKVWTGKDFHRSLEGTLISWQVDLDTILNIL